MFEVLNESPLSTVVRSVYFANRVLRERHLYPTLASALDNRALAKVEGEPNYEMRAVAVGLIEEMIKNEDLIRRRSTAEGPASFPLSDEAAERYSRELSEIMHARAQAEINYDPEKAQRLIDELKREFAVIPKWRKGMPVS